MSLIELHAIRLVVPSVMLVFNLNAQVAAPSGNVSPPPGNSPQVETTVPPPPPPSTTQKSGGPLNDYVPCLFDSGQQRAMRAFPPAGDIIDYSRSKTLYALSASALSAAALDALSKQPA